MFGIRVNPYVPAIGFFLAAIGWVAYLEKTDCGIVILSAMLGFMACVACVYAWGSHREDNERETP